MNDFNIEELKEDLSKISSNIEPGEIYSYPCFTIPAEKLKEVAEFLKKEFSFDQLRDIIGVDRFTKDKRFECIYNLYSTHTLKRIFLRVKLDSKNPEVDSLYPVWQSANWAEREVYDMYGISFRNHPDLRRMYMTEEFEYYPLRKDFPLMGIPGSIQLPRK